MFTANVYLQNLWLAKKEVNKIELLEVDSGIMLAVSCNRIHTINSGSDCISENMINIIRYKATSLVLLYDIHL